MGQCFLIECTLEKPFAKFSGLSERAKELQERIGPEADVFPAVFTRSELATSEREQALEYGVTVVGRLEIKELFELLNKGANARESLNYLSGLRTGLRIELGALAERWQRNW